MTSEFFNIASKTPFNGSRETVKIEANGTVITAISDTRENAKLATSDIRLSLEEGGGHGARETAIQLTANAQYPLICQMS